MCQAYLTARVYVTVCMPGISTQLLEWKGIEATEKLAQSKNSKIVMFGNPTNGLPTILGGLESALGGRQYRDEQDTYGGSSSSSGGGMQRQAAVGGGSGQRSDRNARLKAAADAAAATAANRRLNAGDNHPY